QGGVEGTIYHQAIISGVTNRIGVEAVDPQYFIGPNCPPGRFCRYSDIAFVRRDGGSSQSTPLATAKLGYLAATDYGKITMLNTKFHILGEVQFAIEGELLSKVGRTTGLSEGEVSDACVDINVYKNGVDTGLTLLCQDMVKAQADKGDSGSPVF